MSFGLGLFAVVAALWIYGVGSRLPRAALIACGLAIVIAVVSCLPALSARYVRIEAVGASFLTGLIVAGTLNALAMIAARVRPYKGD